MKKISFLLIGIALSFAFVLNPDDEKKLVKPGVDDNSKFTNVGNLGLTITNFGMYGHGFSKWPTQPNAEYPIGSGIEHIFDGGLWIGAFTSSDASGSGRQGPFVTTGAVDAASVSSARGGGFEFTNDPESVVRERSSLLDSRFYHPDAVSHQDFVAVFNDTNRVLAGGQIIEGHNPIGVVVRQETYAWNFTFANNFIIMNYWVKNVSNRYLDSVYVGLWTDAVVRNTNVTSPRSGSSFFDKGGNGFADSLNIAYEFDATGDIGFTDSYLGVQFLGASNNYDSVNFNTWQFRNTSDPNLFAPQNDIDRYRKMQGYSGGDNRYPLNPTPAQIKLPSNRSIMITAGSFRTIAPGDSVNVVFAIITAKKWGTQPASLDNEEQKLNLYTSAEWALRAYFGEDRNRNGILDPGEDLNGDGKLTRYILPTPPLNPKVKVIPGSQKATIYWDKRAETSIDPITGEMDFEGYRLYRTNTGFDLTQNQNLQNALVKMLEFDSLGNSIGFNTGFGVIELMEPMVFEGDTTKYWYKYEVNNLLNGWQYVFSVTAFDKGDEEYNLESLESAPLTNAFKIIPGVAPTSDEEAEVGVYPNPYYANAYWDGNSERLRKIYFNNLPAECEITIYTLAGDIIKRIDHNGSSNGSNLRWFQTYSRDGSQVMSGGEHAWDLITDNDQAIATGLYLFTVRDLQSGKIKTGKFLIVK
jgi:hypothetical protein